MCQSTPDELAIPDAAVRTAWKQKPEFVKVLDHSIGTFILLKQFEDRANSTLHFLVWIEDNLVAIEDQADWQRETQLTFLPC
jgi:hypothetical protein